MISPEGNSLARSDGAQEKSILRPAKSIVLRAPSRGGESTRAVSHTDTHWCLSHTSRPGWKTQRNVILKFNLVTSSGVARSNPDQTLEISYAGKVGGKRVSEVVDSRWEVLGQGRVGPLQDWMIETEHGIEDSSGEIRADWRDSYLVLYFPSHDSRGDGVDLLTNVNDPLPDELVKELEGALDKSFGWTCHFIPAARDSEFEMPAGRESEPQVWTNPDIYGGEEESSRKCLVQ